MRALRMLVPVCVAGLACASPGAAPIAECAPGAAGVPLAFELRSASGSHAFLQGSVHVAPEAGATLPPRALQELRDADLLVSELDFSKVTLESLAMRMVELGRLPEGERMQDHVAPETWKLFEERSAATGAPAEDFQPFEPWVAALGMMGMGRFQAGFSAQQGVDLQVYGAERPKRSRGLETIEEQLALFDSLDPEAQEAMLLQTLSPTSQTEAELAALFAAWRCGDAPQLEALLDQALAEEPKLAGFYEATIFGRNRSMADELVQLLGEESSAFVVVGAMHLVGARGIPALLAERGYAVEQVRQEEPATPPPPR